MRILTWNVNALRTVLPFRPWNELENKSIEGMLEAMDAEIICFQEHKARRDQMLKGMAVPTGFDAFFSFPYGKGGYSGTCVYTKQSYAVPLKAEEGITGLLLDSTLVGGAAGAGGGSSGGKGGVKCRAEDKVGGYVDVDDIEVQDEVEGGHFDLKRLDMEGRAVVLDFGFFVIFNLYCPNETNDSRLPYKLNFLRLLSARVDRLIRQGRNVIVVGDINVCHTPLDNGEGGIERKAEEHFDHPARVWFDKWIWNEKRGSGVMHDVTREKWPGRKGMYTCWNTKLDARPSNYGARIDYVLVTPGLLPWVKHSDIQADIMGSDHCPVFLDLHETIAQPDGSTLNLRDLMNPTPRIPLPEVFAQYDEPERTAPQPPPFATKFWDEFSGKQRTMKDFFGKKGAAPPLPRNRSSSTNTAEGAVEGGSASTLSFGKKREPTVDIEGQGDGGDQSAASVAAAKVVPKRRDSSSKSAIIDLTEIEEGSTPPRKPKATPVRAKSSSSQSAEKGKSKSKAGDQMKLSSFFRQPSQPSPSQSAPGPSSASPPSPQLRHNSPPQDSHSDWLFAKALAEQDEEVDEEAKVAGRAEAISGWSNIFAKKVPPKCIVHGLPCKLFTTKIPGKNKGKRFWLCSRPVGEGWDNGRSKRPREEVNHEYRCDFFIWDTAVKEKEAKPGDGNAMAPPAKKRKT